MAATRPYLLVFKGETHIIEAPAAANAVQHVVGADISELRPARAAEVTAWARAGKPIPIAGEKPAAAVAADTAPDPAREGFDHHDALAWVQEQEGFTTSAAACAAWGRIVSTKRMTLEDFDIIRADAPSFADACEYAAAGPAPTDVEQIRASLEDNPMTLDDLVEAIGEAKRRDLYVDRDVGALEDGAVQE